LGFGEKMKVRFRIYITLLFILLGFSIYDLIFGDPGFAIIYVISSGAGIIFISSEIKRKNSRAASRENDDENGEYVEFDKKQINRLLYCGIFVAFAAIGFLIFFIWGIYSARDFSISNLDLMSLSAIIYFAIMAGELCFEYDTVSRAYKEWEEELERELSEETSE
jgi:hypothetical protein